MKRLIILFLSAAAFAACSPVRHCKTPELDLPERLAGADGDSLTAADLGWWQFYGDPALRRIIERTLAENKDMLAAAARVERMRQMYRIDKAGRLPDFTARVSADNETNDYYGESSDPDPE